jgi:ribokinase
MSTTTSEIKESLPHSQEDVATMTIITVIGSLNTDMVTVTSRMPDAGETLRASSFNVGWGGKGANQAVAAARLSRSNPKKENFEAMFWGGIVQVRMIGAVGEDPFALPLLKSMEEDGVDVAGVKQLRGETTGTATILVEESTGENRILFTPGANFSLKPTDNLLPEDGYGDLVIFQLETPLELVLHHMQFAKSSGAQVILNPAPAVELPDSAFSNITHLILNETEIEILAHLPSGSIGNAFKDFQESELNHLAREFIEKGVSTIVVTLGANGVFYQTASRLKSGSPGKHLPALKANVVDTTGAGDTFVGAFAVYIASAAPQTGTLASGNPEDELIDDAIAFAIRAATRTVEKAGAQKAIPWLDEVPEEEFGEAGEEVRETRRKTTLKGPRKGGAVRLSCERCYKDKQFCDRKRPCGRCKELRRTDRCTYQSQETTPFATITSKDADLSSLQIAEPSIHDQQFFENHYTLLASTSTPLGFE